MKHMWTAKTTEFFIEMAMLNEDEVYILTSRIKGVPISQQAMHLHKSESSVHRMINTIKRKYDLIQSEYPEELPARRRSASEKWMDNN